MADGLENAYDAEVLSKALPFMQRYENKTVVIKYGGHAMGDPELGKVLVFGFDGTFCGTLHPTSSPPDVSDDGPRTLWKICSVTSDPLSGFALVAHALWRHATCPPGSTNLVGV